MERGNTKHGQRLDEAMAEEVAPLTHAAPIESRADENRQLEPTGPDDAADGSISVVHDHDAPTGIAHDAATSRSEMARFIRPSVFPATATEIVAAARADDATESVLVTLGGLDRHRRYATMQAVWEALGGGAEHRARAVAPPDPHEPVPTAAPAIEPEPEPGPGAHRPASCVRGVARIGLDLVALATWTVADVATGIGRRLDRLRARH